MKKNNVKQTIRPAKVQESRGMKPEVAQIFHDLEEWHNFCRMEMIKFDERDLYRSVEWRRWNDSKVPELQAAVPPRKFYGKKGR